MADNIRPIFTFRPAASGLEKFWGKLEATVLEAVWDNGPLTVKRTLFFVGHKHHYAYTTIMTVMNNLVQKGILKREKSGHSFIYSAVMSKDDFLKYAAGEVIEGLVADYRDLAVDVISRLTKPEKKKK